MRPEADIEGCRQAHVRLGANAESAHRRIVAARRGQVVEQYEGGVEGRAAEIEASATRPAVVLVDDALHWSRELDDEFTTLPDDMWELPVRAVGGSHHPISRMPLARWREVEVHMVDLGLDYTPECWPAELVARCLPRIVEALPSRTDPTALMAWALGRGDPPELEPWG